jgi:hypothetical protein
MALPTNTLTAHAAIGNREDLSDEVYRIAPTDTPGFTALEKVKATGVFHEWQTQDLAAVDTSNAVLEGDDATTDATTPRVRLGNYCQISDKVARVSGTQQAVETAGVGNELDNQAMLKGLELRRDIESMIFGTNVAKVAGAAGVTARKSASILSWIKTNNSSGATGSAPATADGAATRTDGTQRAFTETLLKGVLQSIWTSGGKPDLIMVGGSNKQQFSTFTGRSSGAVNEDAKSKKITASVDAYESDFGTLKVVANRFSRARDALILQTDMWAVGHLNGRKMVSIPLAKTGDSERKQILSEWTLEARNEAASGIVADLTTP